MTSAIETPNVFDGDVFGCSTNGFLGQAIKLWTGGDINHIAVASTWYDADGRPQRIVVSAEWPRVKVYWSVEKFIRAWAGYDKEAFVELWRVPGLSAGMRQTVGVRAYGFRRAWYDLPTLARGATALSFKDRCIRGFLIATHPTTPSGVTCSEHGLRSYVDLPHIYNYYPSVELVTPKQLVHSPFFVKEWDSRTGLVVRKEGDDVWIT